MPERSTLFLLAAVALVLSAGSLAGVVLRRRASTDSSKKTVDNLIARVNAWWVMVGIFGTALWAGAGATITLFAFVSFLALREVLTLTPTRRGDHRTLFWAFFVTLPLQYLLIYRDWYNLFVILIPVYGFLFFAIRSALAGDVTCYLERAAKVYWGVMICVYCLSHVPALLRLDIAGYGLGHWQLVAFLVIVVQMSDVLQYVWGKSLGKNKVAPKLSPSKTWEGLIGGIATASLLGMAMMPLTPFAWWQAFLLAMLICVMGFFGGLVASAIKRDAGVKDYGQLIEGHGGMMDRVDSLAFAAPVFFHVVRYSFT